jgi:hypothetical protein
VERESVGEDQFICEPLTPTPGTFDAAAMARGEPGLPARFSWRGQEYAVAEILKVWKTSSREAGGTEMYLRRHWWTIATTNGLRLTIYCDRQAKDRKKPKARWWVHTVGQDDERGA